MKITIERLDAGQVQMTCGVHMVQMGGMDMAAWVAGGNANQDAKFKELMAYLLLNVAETHVKDVERVDGK